MKKAIIFTILLFLLVGIVSASDDVNTTLSEIPENSTHDFPVLKANESAGTSNSTDSQQVVEKHTLKSTDITSKKGKTITLKTLVSNSKGPVSGVNVIFKFNKNTYTAFSDANGVASVKVKCPASAVLKSVSKTKGSKVTKTTHYSKTYTCTVKTNESQTTFKVISKKTKSVKKYKVAKKTKIFTVKLKNGEKYYKKGNYAFATIKHSENGTVYLNVMGVGKNEGGLIKFYLKHHIKTKSKWKWDKWFKVPKNNYYDGSYPSSVKVDKLKIKYTQKTYKRIR